MNDKDDHIILIVPGLRETTHTATILSLAHSLLLKGFPNIFVLNYRGSCSVSSFDKVELSWHDYVHINCINAAVMLYYIRGIFKLISSTRSNNKTLQNAIINPTMQEDSAELILEIWFLAFFFWGCSFFVSFSFGGLHT